MTLGANQPYFLPYLGYFQLINAVDAFILADEVQYEKGGWINRNRIIQDGNSHYISLPLIKHTHNKTILQHEIFGDLGLIQRSVKSAYCKAPFFSKVYPLVEEMLNYPDRRLNYFLFNSLQVVCGYLGISTPLILNSERKDETSLRGEERVIHLCKSMGADKYINAFGGQELYSKERFARDGIELRFIKPQLPPYKQLRTQEFVPALSILDVIMNVPEDEIRDMLNCYTLI